MFEFPCHKKLVILLNEAFDSNSFRLEAIKEQVKAKSLEEAAEKEGRPPLKRLERQILTETLRYEQEKIQFLRETAKMEKEKLSMDVELARVAIEKARFELELLKRRRLN